MFTKIDWLRKLTSRKFWVALTTFISMLIIACGGTAEKAEKIAALIIAGASAVAYIIGEGLTDAAGASAGTILVTDAEDETEGPQE